jgi:hypothetical protein
MCAGIAANAAPVLSASLPLEERAIAATPAE